MKIMVDTRVPRCCKCSGVLDKGFIGTESYFFCTDCHTQFKIIEQGQAENELLCEEVIHESKGI